MTCLCFCFVFLIKSMFFLLLLLHLTVTFTLLFFEYMLLSTCDSTVSSSPMFYIILFIDFCLYEREGERERETNR